MVEIPVYQASFEYPRLQLGKIEEIVVDAFLDEFGASYDRIGFNVPVWMDPPENRGVLTTRKRSLAVPEPYRIDIVAGFGSEVELIEVKETGNMTAIGQLLTYRMLYLRNFWGFSKLHLRLVCVSARQAIKFSCFEQGINVSEVGDKVTHLVNQVRGKASHLLQQQPELSRHD